MFSQFLEKLKKATDFAQDMFFPENIKCIVCDDELHFDTRYGVCKNCVLTRNADYCKICGSATNELTPICQNCKTNDCEFECARATLVYIDKVADVIKSYKFGRKKYLAKYLAEFVIDCYYENSLSVDIVTFVPIHKTKLRVRGFNQAQEIARHFVLNTALPLVDCLDKTIRPQDTARLNSQQRQEAVKGVFKTKPNIQNLLKGKSVLLIDDVFTTGATANECSRLLKRAGATEVFVLTIATGKGRTIDKAWTERLETMM